MCIEVYKFIYFSLYTHTHTHTVFDDDRQYMSRVYNGLTS